MRECTRGVDYGERVNDELAAPLLDLAAATDDPPGTKFDGDGRGHFAADAPAGDACLLAIVERTEKCGSGEMEKNLKSLLESADRLIGIHKELQRCKQSPQNSARFPSALTARWASITANCPRWPSRASSAPKIAATESCATNCVSVAARNSTWRCLGKSQEFAERVKSELAELQRCKQRQRELGRLLRAAKRQLALQKTNSSPI